MRTIGIFRAQGFPGLDEVDAVTINIHQEMPEVDYQRSRAFFASEGSALAEAIWLSCPGGTIDALIQALMVRRASLFRVPFPSTSEHVDHPLALAGEAATGPAAAAGDTLRPASPAATSTQDGGAR